MSSYLDRDALALLQEVLDLSGDARERLLDSRCGDRHELRARVVKLLAKSNTEETFPVVRVIPARVAPAPRPLRTAATHQTEAEYIGSYRLLSVLGEGGMGTVYLAEQTESVRRQVAIKVVKTGMDSRQVLARFDVERQALAVMSHPAIAKVLDAGSTTAGQPYFVMEFVEGLPITDYCDENHLSLRERIQLFQQVCSAVQHAHQKGVLHRDLKPGNILVTRSGSAEPQVKVIDFGLARSLGDEVLGDSVNTLVGQLIGTLEYMSPEQANGNADQIDTRTDVYSLGIVLYELLTGTLPFAHLNLGDMGTLEALRVLQTVEPGKPSSRVTVGKSATAAHNRRLSEPALHHRLRGDLDWIAMRALFREPEGRYATASDLSQDLDRHFRHEPVIAGPPSTRYRLKKFLRKRREVVAAAAAIFVSLTIGISIAVWQYRIASEERARSQISESLHLVDSSNRCVAAGDHGTALALAQAALPQDLANPDRPFVPKAEAALSRAVTELREIHTIEHDGAIRTVAFRKDGRRLIVGTRNRLSFLDAEDYSALRSFPTDGAIVSIQSFPAAKKLLTLDSRGNVQVRDSDEGKQLAALPARVGTALLSPDGSYIATIDHDGEARIWDAVTCNSLFPLGRAGENGDASFSPDSKRLAITDGNSVRLWDLSSRASSSAAFRFVDKVERVRYAPTGDLIAASDGKAVQVWMVGAKSPFRPTSNPQGRIAIDGFSPDGSAILTTPGASSNGDIQLWRARSTASQAPLATIPVDGDTNTTAFSPDGTRFAATSREHTVVIGTIGSRELTVLGGHRSSVTSMTFSPDGEQLVTGSEDGTVRVWDARESIASLVIQAAPATPQPTEIQPSTKIRFGPDSNRLLAVTGNAATVYRAATGDQELQLSDPKPARIVTLVHLSTRNDGQECAACFGADAIERWDLNTGVALPPLGGHGDWIQVTCYSNDGTLLATCANDGSVRVWSTKTGELVSTCDGHTDAVTDASFGPDDSCLATASADGTARVWNPGTGDCVTVFSSHNKPLSHIEFCSDGKHLLTTAPGDTARFWPLSGKSSHALSVTDKALYSPNGEDVAAIAKDTVTIQPSTIGRAFSIIFDPPTTLKGLGDFDKVYDVAYSHCGKFLATACSDGKVRIWKERSGVVLAMFDAQLGPGSTLQFSRDDTRIVTIGTGNEAQVWDHKSGTCIATLQGHTAALKRAEFLGESNVVITASFDGTVRTWNAANGSDGLTLRSDRTPNLGKTVHGEFDPSGKRILTSFYGLTAQVWGADNGTQIHSLEGHTAPIRHATHSADGQRIITSSDDRTARLWNAATGTHERTLTGHQAGVAHSAFDGSGSWVATASADHTVKLWRVADGQCAATITDHPEPVLRVGFTSAATGDAAVITIGETTVRYWNVPDGTPAHAASPNDDVVDARTCAVSRDGTQFATSAASPTGIRIHSATDGSLSKRLTEAHPGDRCVFSRDAEFLLTRDSDKAHLWRLEDGLKMATFATGSDRDATGELDFSPDGRLVGIVSSDAIHVFPIRIGADLLAHARKVAPRSLTEAQRDRYHLK